MYQDLRLSAKAPHTIKLYYFDSAGRAEAIRVILTVGGVAYEDIRLSQEEWQTFKPKTPFGQLPVLEVDGKMVGQSCACARLAAMITGLAGKSAFEEALADSVADTMNEISNKFVPIHHEEDEQKKKDGMTEFTTKFLPEKLDHFEKFLAKNNGGGDGFFCGGEMTWADLHFVTYMELLAAVVPNCFEGHFKLKTLTERVNADPRVKAYKDKKPAKK